MTRTATKPTFSVPEANRALPLVRSIAQDIVVEFGRLRELGRERRALEASSPVAPASKRRIEDMKLESEDGAARVDGYIKELNELGVELKDPERGLVDFPSDRGGRAVWLCWKLGEASVAHWHGMDETFADRRPVDSGKRGAEKRSTEGPISG